MKLLRKIEIESCDSSPGMAVEVVKRFSNQVEENCCVDALWKVSLPHKPLCILRIFKGRKALNALLSNYSFKDSTGCAYTETAVDTSLTNLFENVQKLGASATYRRNAKHALSRMTKRKYSKNLPPMASPEEVKIILVACPCEQVHSTTHW